MKKKIHIKTIGGEETVKDEMQKDKLNEGNQNRLCLVKQVRRTAPNQIPLITGPYLGSRGPGARAIEEQEG